MHILSHPVMVREGMARGLARPSRPPFDILKSAMPASQTDLLIIRLYCTGCAGQVVPLELILCAELSDFHVSPTPQAASSER